VTFWSEVFLGVISVATLTMAAIHVAVILYGWSMTRRVNRVVAQVEQEMKPLAASLNAIAQDAARISAMTAGQVDRVDRLVTDLTVRIDQTATTLQDVILRPLRDGSAMLAGVKAVIDAFRQPEERRSASTGRTETPPSPD
jgi:hypothetical protein